MCDELALDLSDIDYVSKKLADKGVLISDAPNEESVTTEHDYTQTDYKKIYKFFNKEYPGMRTLVKYIKNVKPLQKGEAEIFLLQIRSGNRKAYSLLIEKYYRTALKMAYSYRDKTLIPLDDIFSVAVMGLIRAINSYDPSEHSHFASYCSSWMMQNVDRYIAEYENIIRIPVNIYNQAKQADYIRCKYNDYDATKAIAEEMSVDTATAEKLYYYTNVFHVMSIEQLMKGKKEGISYSDDNFIDISYFKCLHDVLVQSFSVISEREAYVVKMRNGFNNMPEMTLEEIAISLDLTKERVRQIEVNALRKLKHCIYAKLLLDFLYL